MIIMNKILQGNTNNKFRNSKYHLNLTRGSMFSNIRHRSFHQRILRKIINEDDFYSEVFLLEFKFRYFHLHFVK